MGIAALNPSTSSPSTSSLRGANGARECAPEDRLRDEAIQASFLTLDCFAEPVIGLRVSEDLYAIIDY
jgi:hypothetical protein